MNTSELKLKIFRHIDSLEKSKLEDFYGILINYIQSQNSITDDWLKLSEEQQKGILDAVKEIESGNGISHDEIVAKYSKKYSHA